jgi:hypothetical protein
MTPTQEEIAAFVGELRGWHVTTGMSDDAARKVWLMHKAANYLEHLQRRERMLCEALRQIHKQGDRLHTTNGTIIRECMSIARAALKEDR